LDCPVVRYFARAAIKTGTYQTTLGYRRSEWYALTDTRLNDSYRARTVACAEASESRAAHVTLNTAAGGFMDLLGSATPATCQVDQVYVLTPLP
jgi:hypothetical protein